MSSWRASSVLLLLANLGDRFLLKGLLEEQGYMVVSDFVPEEPPQFDAALVDCRVEKEKVETLLSFKAQEPLFLPVIALAPETVSPKHLYQMGFDDCWHYPLYKEELVRRLKFFLDLREKMHLLKEQEERERLEALGLLAIGIAHDFNNLLTPILGYADLCLLKAKNSPELAGYLKHIKKTVLKTRELTEQIFLFCNSARDSEKEVDLVAEVRQLEPLLRDAVPDRISFEVFLPEDPCWVRMPPSHLHRLLLNLITNAAKAIKDSGKIILEVKREGDKVLLFLKDTGVGFEKEVKKKIFSLFYSGRKSSGLGLAIVKNIVEEAGGRIEVESKVGRGTTFKIVFPSGRKEVLAEEPPKSPLSKRSGKKILVVDDEVTIQELFRQFMEMLGFEVLSASGIKEALSLFERHREELVLLITDYYLGEGTGGDLIIAIRRLSPELPVICCTGLREEPDLPRVPNLKVLPKPFSLSELQAVLEELIPGEATF